MSTPSEDPQRPSSPDMVSNVTEFARLAQHVLSGSTPGSYGISAQRLLVRLLQMSEMQRGALLLVWSDDVELQGASWLAQGLSGKMLRPLALQGINDDELTSLLVTLADHRDEQTPMVSFDQGWIICQQVLPAHDVLRNGKSRETLSASFPSPLSFFFLAEAEKQAQTAVEALWSQVADAVGMVIMSLLQAERMVELETAARHRDREQMELLKAELLATVSHELRSPLTSIKGYAATLLRHEQRISQEEQHEFLIAIADASQRLEVVVDRLLEVSQLETATLPLKRASVDLVSLAREAIAAVERDAGRTSGPVLPKQRESVPPIKWTFTLRIEGSHGNKNDEFSLLQADQRLLRKVLDHLLENAVLYSPAGGKIEVGLRKIEPEKVHLLSQKLAKTLITHRSTLVFPPSWSPDQPMAEMWIQDHGIGIPSEHLSQIFQRFYRVDTSLTRGVNGLGLGLAICQRIVELHEGLLWAESELGKGTTFHVLLPLKRDC